MTVTGGLVTTSDLAIATWLRSQKGDVGREVPLAELTKYAPQLSGTAFEPAPHVMFGATTNGEAHTASKTKGNHGFWPTRPDYRSIFLLSGPGIKPGKLGTLEMVSLEDRLTGAMGVSCPKP
jgi:predicted AlkP superfamily pyrophosphatase or phosphodiesterase